MTSLCLLIAILSACATPVHADEPFDPAARARAIAPFIEEETMSITHVDFARVDVDAAVDQVGRLIPGMPDQSKERKQGKQMLAALSKAGIQEAYYVVTLFDNPFGRKANTSFYVVIPLPDVARSTHLHELPQAKLLKEAGRGENLTHFAIKDNALLAGSEALVKRLMTNKPDVRPALEKAFAAAGDSDVQVLLLPPKHIKRVLAEMLPQLPPKFGGGSSAVLTNGCLWAAVGIDLPPKLSIKATVQSVDADAAQALLARWKQVGGLLADNKKVRKDLPNLPAIWEALTPRIERDQVLLELNEQNGKVARLIELFAPPVMAARAAAKRIMSANQLKQIALAMHYHLDAHKRFPAAATYDKNGRPLLSWRVHLLPYLEHKKLYEQFHLDEPWDSPHNKKLIEKMPRVYRSTGSQLPGAGRTNYVAFTGKGTVFEGKTGLPVKEIPDGASSTIMIVEANDTHAVIWTKPEDLPFDPEHPQRGLGDLWNKPIFQAVFCDGSIHAISTKTDPAVLRGMVLTDDAKYAKKKQSN
jgi:hypothetical protein